MRLPSQPTTIGLLAALNVLRTKTAFGAGVGVVRGAVDVVTAGVVVVVSVHGKPSQGHPAGQFSLMNAKFKSKFYKSR